MGTAVNHPDYYQLDGNLEAIDVIKAKTKGMKGFDGYVTGKILEHALRWDKKNGKKDLEEIAWWSQYMINEIDSEIKKQVDMYTNQLSGGVQ